jgi:hypothetical protein
MIGQIQIGPEDDTKDRSSGRVDRDLTCISGGFPIDFLMGFLRVYRIAKNCFGPCGSLLPVAPF